MYNDNAKRIIHLMGDEFTKRLRPINGRFHENFSYDAKEGLYIIRYDDFAWDLCDDTYIGNLVMYERNDYFIGRYNGPLVNSTNGSEWIVYNKEGEKILYIPNGKGNIFERSYDYNDKTDHTLFTVIKSSAGEVYTHYEVRNGKLFPMLEFDEIVGYKNKNILVIEQNGQKLPYHYKKGVTDPYDFFDEYHDKFGGINYSEKGMYVGIGTVGEDENIHTIIGIVNSNGVLVSALLDWNTSTEYGSPYMDPTSFEDALDEIKKKIKQECMLESEERTKRAKVNIKIMTR